MTTVAQLIAHLQTLPQEAIVWSLAEKDSFHSSWVEWQDLEIEADIDVIDLRGNEFVKPENPNFNKVFVKIGRK